MILRNISPGYFCNIFFNWYIFNSLWLLATTACTCYALLFCQHPIFHHLLMKICHSLSQYPSCATTGKLLMIGSRYVVWIFVEHICWIKTAFSWIFFLDLRESIHLYRVAQDFFENKSVCIKKSASNVEWIYFHKYRCLSLLLPPPLLT